MAQLFNQAILAKLGNAPVADGSLRAVFYDLQHIGKQADRLSRQIEARKDNDVAVAGILHRVGRLLRDLSTSLDVAVAGLSDDLRNKIAGVS